MSNGMLHNREIIMQINDIMNSEIGSSDKAKSIGMDPVGNHGKVITNQPGRHEDYTKIEKDKLGVISMSNHTYRNPNNNTIMDDLEKGLGAEGKVNTASTLNQRNFNAIEELGFDSKDMDEKEFVDIADKIRIAMAKGGADISMMGDISDAAIRQSGGYSPIMENALKEAQLPSDDKTVQDSVIALRKVDEIRTQMVDSSSVDAMQSFSENPYPNDKSLSEETIKYMLKNELDPTIDNLYKASTYSNDFATEEPAPISGNTDSLEAQFEEVILKAGLTKNEANLNDCYYMLKNRIGVTPEQLIRFNELRGFDIGGMNDVVNAITNSIAEGESAGDAYLVPGHSPMAEATAITEGIKAADENTVDKVIENNEPVTLGNVARQALTDIVKADDNVNAKASLQELVTPDYISVEKVEQNNFSNNTNQESSPNNGTYYNEITVKKQLVEVQLMMTTQANFSLLKNGISLDTLELSDYVKSLEELEQHFLETMLGDKASPAAIKNLSDSMDAVTKSKELPDYAMPLNASSMTLRSYASISISYSEVTETSSEEGTVTTEAAFSAKFVQAADYYESSATEIRRDLGDSIRKAFRNVDNLLDEIKMDHTEDNRRAVRILGYNQMEITEESVKEVKAEDLIVRRALDSLKPGVVANMVKQGMNPLDMTMEELMNNAEEIMGEMEVSSEEEKFSEFLWRLEQENGITEEEREGFIGVFRLIHQVNESDGAAIGMLLQQNAEVTMRNLLTATRTAKRENREYTVDDDFGGIEGFNKDSLNIEQQIEMSIQSVNMKKAEDSITPYKMMQFNGEEEYMSLTPEQLSSRLDMMESDEAIAQYEAELTDSYNATRREEVLQSFNASREVIEYLEANDMPLTANNINAITALMTDKSMMSTLFNRAAKRQVGLDRKGSYASEVGMDKADDSESLQDEIQDIIANLIHEYGESVKTPEDMAEAEQRLEEMAENVMKNMIIEEDVRTIDVRGMHLIQTAIHTQGEVSERTENYTIPIMVADEVGNLSLKIVRGKEEKGLVDIAFDMEKTGAVTASFRYEAGEFVGEVNCDRETTREMLEKHEEALRRAVSDNTSAEARIEFSWSKKMDVTGFVFGKPDTDFETVSKAEAMEGNDGTQAVLTKSLYGMARAFIEELGNI